MGDKSVFSLKFGEIITVDSLSRDRTVFSCHQNCQEPKILPVRFKIIAKLMPKLV